MRGDDQSLWVVLPLTIIEGQETAWEAFVAEMRAQVAAQEPGTLRFDMYRRKDVPGGYVMIEHYADQDAWDEHSRLQGERSVVPRMIQFQSGPPDFMFLEPVAGPLRE